MTDIVERLRQGIGIGPDEHADAEQAMDDAADEIEWLRVLADQLVRLHDALVKIVAMDDEK
jgi:hypothetical protein